MTNVKVNSSQVEEFKKFVYFLAKWTQLLSPEIEFAVLLYRRYKGDKPIEDVWLEFAKTHSPRIFRMRILHDRYPS